MTVWHELTVRIGTTEPIQEGAVLSEQVALALVSVICKATGEESMLVDGVSLVPMPELHGVTIRAEVTTDGVIARVSKS